MAMRNCVNALLVPLFLMMLMIVFTGSLHFWLDNELVCSHFGCPVIEELAFDSIPHAMRFVMVTLSNNLDMGLSRRVIIISSEALDLDGSGIVSFAEFADLVFPDADPGNDITLDIPCEVSLDGQPATGNEGTLSRLSSNLSVSAIGQSATGLA